MSRPTDVALVQDFVFFDAILVSPEDDVAHVVGQNAGTIDIGPGFDQVAIASTGSSTFITSLSAESVAFFSSLQNNVQFRALE